MCGWQGPVPSLMGLLITKLPNQSMHLDSEGYHEASSDAVARSVRECQLP